MLAGRVTTDILHTVKKKVCEREKQTESKMNRKYTVGPKNSGKQTQNSGLCFVFTEMSVRY